MVRLRVIVFCILAAANMLTAGTAAPAAQNQASAAGDILTLEQALLIADQNNRDIEKAAEYKNWVEGRYVEARASALPQFNFFATGRRDYDNTYSDLFGGLIPATQDTAQMTVSVTQPIYTFGKIGAAIKAAHYGFGFSDQLLRQARQTTRRDVTGAFYNVLLAQELDRIASENEQQKRRQYDQAQQRYKLGTATDYDVLAAEVDWRNARPPAISAQNAVLISKRQLLFLLGQEYREIEIRGSLDVHEAPPPPYEQVVANAFKARPELLAQHEMVNIRYELVKIAKAGNKPSLDFNGAYGNKYLSSGNLNVDGKVWSAGITFNFPFFDGLRTSGQAAEATSDWNSARIDEAKLKEAITLEARVALDRVNEASDVLAATSDTVTQAERLVKMAEQGYELGVKIRLEVDDAQLNLIRARGSLATARRDYLVAWTNLLWVQGQLE